MKKNKLKLNKHYSELLRRYPQVMNLDKAQKRELLRLAAVAHNDHKALYIIALLVLGSIVTAMVTKAAGLNDTNFLFVIVVGCCSILGGVYMDCSIRGNAWDQMYEKTKSVSR